MPTVFPSEMMHDSVWMDRNKFVEAENHCQRFVVGNKKSPTIQANIIPQMGNIGAGTPTRDARLSQLEEENKSMKSLLENLSKQLTDLTLRVVNLEGGTLVVPAEQKTTATAPVVDDDDDDDDDFDLFSDDDEDEEETEEDKKKREALLAKYKEKKSKKPAVIAKSNIILDVKPWDDETDMAEMERKVRTIEMDGLLWGDSKLVPLAYGIRKLQISCVVEDDKVGSEILSEKITEFEDLVQSVDVAAFNKI